AYYVARSTCTFDTEPRPMEGWRTWLAHHRDAHPATVALRDGTIVGWGSLSAWSDRPAYRHTVEDSVYVCHDMHRQGIGAVLLADLLARAGALGHVAIIARIAADQPISEALHERFGFERIGVLRRVGYKFDRWLDVAMWERVLEAAPGSA